MSVLRKFHAVEAVLQFHHTTARNPLRVTDLLSRVRVSCGLQLTKEDIFELVHSWPEGYRVDKRDSVDFIGAVTVCASTARELAFKAALENASSDSNKENALPQAQSTTPKPKVEIIRGKTPCETTLKRTREVPTMEALLDRIQAKRVARDITNGINSIERREQFLKAQIPAIVNVLQTLCTSRDRFSMGELTTKVMGSLKTRLSLTEIADAIQLVAAQMPEFCSIVRSGKLTVVKMERLAPVFPLVCQY